MLNPWHTCGPSCYWWADSTCHVGPETHPAEDAGLRGCHLWVCAVCGKSWDQEGGHEGCHAPKRRGGLAVCVKQKKPIP